MPFLSRNVNIRRFWTNNFGLRARRIFLLAFLRLEKSPHFDFAWIGVDECDTCVCVYICKIKICQLVWNFEELHLTPSRVCLVQFLLVEAMPCTVWLRGAGLPRISPGGRMERLVTHPALPVKHHSNITWWKDGKVSDTPFCQMSPEISLTRHLVERWKG